MIGNTRNIFPNPAILINLTFFQYAIQTSESRQWHWNDCLAHLMHFHCIFVIAFLFPLSIADFSFRVPIASSQVCLGPGVSCGASLAPACTSQDKAVRSCVERRRCSECRLRQPHPAGACIVTGAAAGSSCWVWWWTYWWHLHGRFSQISPSFMV